MAWQERPVVARGMRCRMRRAAAEAREPRAALPPPTHTLLLLHCCCSFPLPLSRLLPAAALTCT